MFKVGDIVHAIECHTQLRTGAEYRIRHIGANEGTQTLIYVDGLDSGYYAYRFELVQHSTPIVSTKIGHFILSIINSEPIDREGVRQIYKYRLLAAGLWKFNTEPGRQVRDLRRRNGALQNGTRYRLNHKSTGLSVTYYAVRSERVDAVRTLRDRIQTQRRSAKFIRHDDGFCRRCHTHHKPYEILNQFYTRALLKYKKPLTAERHVGIEIECALSEGTGISQFLPLKEYLSVGEDASIKAEDGYEGKEFKILATTENFEERIERICALLKESKAMVNDSCGLHVHLDMRGMETPGIQQQYLNLVRAQKFLMGMVSQKRRLSTYCKPSTARSFRGNDRYRAINSLSLERHSTIEIRLHHGTLDATEIINWTKILLVISVAPPMQRTCANMETFSKKISLPSDLKIYMEKRASANSPVPEIITTQNNDPCEEDHGGEECDVCGAEWDMHNNHECENGRAGTFPGCTESTERVELANV